MLDTRITEGLKRIVADKRAETRAYFCAHRRTIFVMTEPRYCFLFRF
jgi:hypothetical protein